VTRYWNRSAVAKQLLAETLVVAAGTLFFFGLAATVGIPSNPREATTAAAADEAIPTEDVPTNSRFEVTRSHLERGRVGLVSMVR
jgi:hypothetical protein